jgi:uncharacterized protein (TIGR03790 family)
MPSSRCFWACVVFAVMACLSTPVLGLDSNDLLVLYNAANSDSQTIANYYATVHPGVHLLGLTGLGSAEQIDANTYLSVIRPQVQNALTSSIDCIVTTKGLPLRIYNSGQQQAGRYSSLESELARVDTISTKSQMASQNYSIPGSLALNPYYSKTNAFSYGGYGTRLTARLDGFALPEVEQSIDRAQRAVVGRPNTYFVMDDDPNCTYMDLMPQLAAVLDQKGQPYIYDQTSTFVRTAAGQVTGYVSHGLYGGAPVGYVADANVGIRFDLVPGAMFHSWESFNAYSFTEGGNRSGQPLVAEWIRRGGTIGLGTVEEPGADIYTVSNENLAYSGLLQGRTWAESAWSATKQLSYVNTVVGDPLMVLHNWIQGDVDLDGDVDLFDISAVTSAYDPTGLAGRYSPYCDMNGNGIVDLWDLMFVQTHYTGPICQYPALVDLDGVQVPEPSSVALLSLGLLAALRRRPTFSF